MPEGAYAVLGVDPGDTTGICFSYVIPAGNGRNYPVYPALIQVNGPWVASIVRGLLQGFADGMPVYSSIEKYVVSAAARKSKKTTAVLEIIDEVSMAIRDHNMHNMESPHIPVIHIRPAATVKPWATDERLVLAGYWTAQAHARDGARQCLYMECYDLGRRDPLSREAR